LSVRRNKRKRAKYLSVGGHSCESKFEKACLDDLLARGVGFAYEPESLVYSTSVRLSSCTNCGSSEVVQRRSYTPDLKFPNGLFVELKGRLDGKARRLLKAASEQHPSSPIWFVFQQNNLYGSAGKRYSDFATQIGARWALGKVPQEWIDAKYEDLFEPASKSAPTAEALGTTKEERHASALAKAATKRSATRRPRSKKADRLSSVFRSALP
jgi:hypothetical protein